MKPPNLMLRTLALLALLTLSARADVPALLNSALESYAVNAGRWAYTQESLKGKEGREGKGDVERFDPSRAPGERWTLLKKEGRVPTEEEKREYSRKRAKGGPKRRALGELLRLDQATVAEKTGASVIYEVPLRKADNTRFPPEKFLVRVHVNRERAALERIEVRLRDPFRMALIAKIRSGSVDVEFVTVDPQHPPVMRRVRGDGSCTVMFVKIDESFERIRTDFKRVTPFDERFDVKVGDLKTLDF